MAALDAESRRAFDLFGATLDGLAFERVLREVEPSHLTALQVLGAVEDLRYLSAFLGHLGEVGPGVSLPPVEVRLLGAVRLAADAVQAALTGLEAAVEKTLS